jgi:hypothetical protein
MRLVLAKLRLAITKSHKLLLTSGRIIISAYLIVLPMAVVSLTGIFKGNVQRKDVITNRWVDISEVKFLDPSFDKYEVLNFKIVYLPMNYELTSKDLDLNDDWKIFAYWFDYDRHKTTYDEKVWQFAVKNKKTGRTNTFIASDIEKKLLAKCGINSDKKGDRSQRQDNQAQ